MKVEGCLLDTNIVRGWFGDDPLIKPRLDALQGKDRLYVSVITIGEIEFAHTNNNAMDGQRQMKFLRDINRCFEVPRLDVDESAAWEYARFRRAVFDITDPQGKYTENREDNLGQKCGIDENDLWLVAQAYEHKLKLITADSMDVIRDAVGNEVEIDVWPSL